MSLAAGMVIGSGSICRTWSGSMVLMKQLMLLTILLITTACGGTFTVLEQYTDEELLVYVERYRAEIAPPSGAQVYSTFGELESPTVGRCNTYTSGQLEILIDRDYWERSSEVVREILMYHELSHCLLGLRHDDRVVELPDGRVRAASIMNIYTIHEDYYVENREMYIEDLRSKIR
jgi:hypothetical protein